MFNKDLEEIKKSQSIINNVITVNKSILQVTRDRITEAEVRIHYEEDEAERKKGKELKEIRTTSETSRTLLITPT